ncbi:DinB family protein [Antarcticibacterium sp. 1MA-6-2]|uniref:DinB family protein n=1 Tax=Antarcticibacterium sp. 1MA-6-2 TaxID=2908210 RepID=UPI001F2F1258|nr:DinB family protein [Antarcticibacterium sp. 1MA-6-2]UJH91793.1 DinB family protein [Antarcticibacterium sp. 1MA-6-2]
MTPAQLDKLDYPEYYQKYIRLLPQDDLLDLLSSQAAEMKEFISKLTNNDLKYSYAEGKWTVGQVLQHMLDNERIFQYRALCIARKDQSQLPGYDQDAYVSNSLIEERTTEDFKEEFEVVRNSGILLFKNFNEKMLRLRGSSNGYPLSTAAAGFIIVGHEKHHLNLFRSSYNL